MSGKYTKSKTKKKKHLGLWIALCLALGVLVAVILMLPSQPEEELHNAQIPILGGTQVFLQDQNATGNHQLNLSIPVREFLEIQMIGSYTGAYMEDGSDEMVAGVLMLKLANNSDDTVEYAKINMNVGEKTAEFTVTTLKPGTAVILLEKNRMTYDNTVDYINSEIVCENLAVFQEPLSLQEEKLNFQILNGAVNVTNISGQDIPGRIAVYYKNKADGLYYGGITYRVVLEEGLKAGELRQIMASHFSGNGSEILFATVE